MICSLIVNVVFLIVTLSADPGETFRGFFLQTRKPNVMMSYGTFATGSTSAHTIDCFGQTNVSLQLRVYC